MVMDIELIVPKVNRNKVKKKKDTTVYRDSKVGVHITTNGLGIVSGLVHKSNKKRK